MRGVMQLAAIRGELMNNHELNHEARKIVEAELLRRGVAPVTPRGTRKIHLHATNSSRSRTVVLQVKSKQKGNWHTTTDEIEPSDRPEDFFWVFVDLGGIPRYWIVPDRWIREDIQKSHQQYLTKHGGHRAENDSSKHHSIHESRLEAWQNKWEILGIFSKNGTKGLADDEADPVESSKVLDFIPIGEDRRKVVERQIRERRGQQQFRDALRKRFGDRCLVTGCEVLSVLEAAHISPYRGEDDNHPANGLLLRADIHTLFDLDLLGIEPEELRVELHPDIVKEYGEFADTRLRCDEKVRPAPMVLSLRYERFRGRLVP